MGGWSATGTRVTLGGAESQEERWKVQFNGPWIKETRTVSQKRAEWRGLTNEGAAARTPTAGWKIVSRERVDESNQWVVREELVVYGTWK
jgi:hypothetical protein